MSKRFIIGLFAGIAVTELLFALQPDQVMFYYGAVLAGSAIASAVSGRFLAGFLVPVYVVGWKVAGAVFLAKQYGGETISANALTYFADCVLVLASGAVGARIGCTLSRYRRKAEPKSGQE